MNLYQATLMKQWERADREAATKRREAAVTFDAQLRELNGIASRLSVLLDRNDVESYWKGGDK